MARIDVLRYTLEGKPLAIPINVGKDGDFRATIDKDLYEKLWGHIEAKDRPVSALQRGRGGRFSYVSHLELSKLKSAIAEAILVYNEASKTQALFIGVDLSLGNDCQPSGSEHPSFSQSWNDDRYALKLHYNVYLCETLTGDVKGQHYADEEAYVKTGLREIWYETRRLPKDHAPDSRFPDFNQPLEVDKRFTKGNRKGWKQASDTHLIMLPYSDEIVSTLDRAQQAMKEIGHGLHAVFSGTTEEIVNLLTNEQHLISEG